MDLISIDAQFVNAIEIAQRLPQGSSTSYEDKLLLYSLYKQATEGDIGIPRPGMLDLLGRAKWDSWNNQKGVNESEAKRLYVSTLLKILQRLQERGDDVTHFITELASVSAFSNFTRSPSPVSSSSSYHSSQASPPEDGEGSLMPPDPLLPIPDVAPHIIPPSALNSTHRSLVNLTLAQYTTANNAAYVSDTRSLQSPFTQQIDSRSPSVSNILGQPAPQHISSDSRLPGPLLSPVTPIARDLGPSDMNQLSASPVMSIYQPTPAYPGRPASTSTFSHAPLNVPLTLQQIQTSLSALHERLATLERSQAVLLRLNDRRHGWFWTTKDDELDDAEEASARQRWLLPKPAVSMRTQRNWRRLSFRVLWILIATIRRAALDIGVSLLVVVIARLALGTGRRQMRSAWGALRVVLSRVANDC